MPASYQIFLTDSPDPEKIRKLNKGLEEFNLAMGAPADWKPLSIFIHDQQGRFLGGLTGGTYWGWLYVGTLWLDGAIRGQGLGRKILAQAEKEAEKRGCRHAFLDTTSFQALPFYLKQGYEQYAQLDDFPPGQARYFLKKDLNTKLSA
jgi:GNAT superfamily N-acetyltransferase